MSGDILKAVKKANIRFGENVRKGDAAGLAALFTEDTVLMPPNSEKLYGKKATEQFWGGALTQMGLKDAVLSTVEIFGSGDTVTEVGNYTLKAEPEGQEPVEDRGKYFVVWKQTDEGLKLHRDIWNSDLTPP
jgi:ketosteroid isomerase-like protein